MPETTPRAIRIPDDLWHAALAKAKEREESVSDIVRRALERYVARK
jgi:predicted CopG family antitoxin